MLGTLADDLSCPVQPPSLVLYSTVQYPKPYTSTSTRRHEMSGEEQCMSDMPGVTVQ